MSEALHLALHSASDDSVVAAANSAFQLALQYFPLSLVGAVGATVGAGPLIASCTLASSVCAATSSSPGSAASIPASAPGQKTPAVEPDSGTYCGLACLVSTQVALEYSCHALQAYNEQRPLHASRVWSESTFKTGTALESACSFFISHPLHPLHSYRACVSGSSGSHNAGLH